jgi:hypothetical protein
LILAASQQPVQPTKRVVIDGADLNDALERIAPGKGTSVSSLKFPDLQLLLLALVRVLKPVSLYSLSLQSKIQFRKVLSKVRIFAEDYDQLNAGTAQSEVFVS